jgi:hypothetical protein
MRYHSIFDVIGRKPITEDRLPADLKETGLGGVASTPTGRQIKHQVFKEG